MNKAKRTLVRELGEEVTGLLGDLLNALDDVDECDAIDREACLQGVDDRATDLLIEMRKLSDRLKEFTD